MAPESNLEDKASSGRFYMNKIFGRGLEQVRALDRNGTNGKALGAVRRVTIEPQSNGGHRVVVERSAVTERGGHSGLGAGAGRIGSSPVSEHSFAHADDAIHFLNDVLTDRPPAPSGGGEAGRFLDQVLDENGGGKI
ncbi:MAG TPA: hypothetical protein VNJ12_06695 [Candidatus Dormibacteraeota bacterium]|nr:hypothetical protein [Candidatus Dormibacteraeota bacterium]